MPWILVKAGPAPHVQGRPEWINTDVCFRLVRTSFGIEVLTLAHDTFHISDEESINRLADTTRGDRK